ncbi:hypothetical protein CP532_2027 [Ophiocordyceps camponoti-leonardi (nom. inval.)]|nr:hypothetical protein CP532_2027 [Ophiocordyceps camponoti-leonardi (nom. inval.)]
MAGGRIGQPPSDKVHPFFAKATGKDASPSHQMTQAATSMDSNSALNSGDENRRRKRRKTESQTVEPDPEPRKSRRKKGHGLLRDSPTSSCTTSPETRQSQSSSTSGPRASAPGNSTTSASQSPATEHPAEPEPPNSQNSSETAQMMDTPRKNKRYLKFNPKTGTLGSPPKQNKSSSPSMLVHIQYGHDDATRRTVGAKVTQILDGELQMPDGQTRDGDNPSLQVCNTTLRKQEQEKITTHPFFSGKSRSLAASEQSESTVPTQKPAACRNSVFMSTPVSPRKQRNPFTANSSNKIVNFGIKSMGVKVPGAMYPMWPAAGMSHVRGPDVKSDSAAFHPGSPLSKKCKGLITAITPQESILTRLLDQLDLQSVHRSLPRDEECFAPAPPELRLPRRRFESGRVLQKRIRPRLGPSSLAPSGPDELSEDDLTASPMPEAHAAIFRHYHSLLTNLSAFDRSSCENQAWTQKYAPTTAAQVLQAGKEMTLLKQWLEALKVQSIDTGSDAGSDRSKIKRKPGRKRRVKLQGFVVDSDEEANGVDELSEVEDESNMADTGLIKRSLIRTGDTDFRSSRDSSKLRNTIVISGPHGCGKTAAVYAVAKEIGFEVFEINSGSRRSGKDILEKVGDMTRNHLVQQHKNRPSSAAAVETDDEKYSGSKKPMPRGPMSSFLKSKPATMRAKAASQKAKDKTEASPAASVPQSQKQSLILLEEADVLYEEDKQFWQTLMGMMMQSKRPFVVTCSDESLIPLQSLDLHGIFRFTPPQAKLAVDVCLLIAANEGHALERKAVDSLYRSRGDDLRATISELNYWCQTGIGDRRGGSDWFYPRWPKGSDVDARGDVIRVISEGTYLRGMGWIGRDPFATAEPREAEEDALRQAWDSWRVDMGDWRSWCDIDVSTQNKPSSTSSSPSSSSCTSSSSFSSSTSSPSSQRRAKAKALAAYDEFCCAMSGSDLCAGGAFGTLLQEPIDCTLPDLLSSVRDDFIIGRTLLEADSTSTMRTTTTDIAITIKSLARASLVCSADGGSIMRQPKAVDELRTTRMLDRSFRTSQRRQLTRHDLSLAFDPISASAKMQTLSHLEPSVFDRTLRLIVLDVAPWVRSIIVFERRLMRDRVKLSNLLSQGGKRRRTTRAAYSALEGGERRTTRREKYFGSELSSKAVMLTGATSFVQGEGHDAAEDDEESE